MNTKKIEELEQTIKQAQKQIEELKQEDEMPKFKYPKMGDLVWYINSFGQVDYFHWCNCISDRVLFHQGGIFLTKEETEFEKERRKVIAELELFKEPEDREWDGVNAHYYIQQHLHSITLQETIELCSTHYNKRNDVYFETKEDCQKAIDLVGRDRVKKYFLRVKE